MTKNKIILAIVVIVVVVGVILIFKSPSKDSSHGNSTTGGVVPGNENNPAQTNTISESNDICGTFSKESIASITGLNIVSSEVFTVSGSTNTNCRYYVSGKSYAPVLSIGKYERDIALEKQKYANETYYPGWRMLTDNRISMEHFITYNEVQQLNDIYLITGTNEYYRITLYSLEMLKGYQMIDLASQIAAKIK